MEGRVLMIHILDQKTDKLGGWVDDPLYDSHKSSISNEETYDFRLSTTEKGAELISERSRILIPSEEGDYREFIIHQTRELSSSHMKEVYSVGSFMDLDKLKIIRPQILEGQTIRTAGEFVLAGIEDWELGITDYSPVRKWEIKTHQTAYSALKLLATLFDLEIRFRITTNGSFVTGRYVDFIKRKGMNRGKELVMGKDLMG